MTAGQLVLRGKVVVVGEAAVGKTSICRSFASDGGEFPKTYAATSACELTTKTVNVPDAPRATSVELHVYDIAGLGVYANSIERFLDGASAVICVYDSNNEASFKAVGEWYEKVRTAGGGKVLPGFILSNKSDLEDKKSVSPTKGMGLAQQLGLEFMEVSAARNVNIPEVFARIAASLAASYEEKRETFAQALA